MISDHEWYRRRAAILLGVICRVCEYPGVKSTRDSITTFDHYTVLVCVHKLVIKNYLPLGVVAFPTAVTEELCLELLRSAVLVGEILE
jgi:hypothetical protein